LDKRSPLRILAGIAVGFAGLMVQVLRTRNKRSYSSKITGGLCYRRFEAGASADGISRISAAADIKSQAAACYTVTPEGTTSDFVAHDASAEEFRAEVRRIAQRQRGLDVGEDKGTAVGRLSRPATI
jgi:hypothetical protein